MSGVKDDSYYAFTKVFTYSLVLSCTYACSRVRISIRSSGKYLSFTDLSFITIHLYTKKKPNLSNVVIFILIEQNGSYVIR